MTVPSCANLREHWRKRAARVAVQRGTAKMVLSARRELLPKAAPFTVTFTRMAARHLDTDNLAFSFKAIRDGVAEALGVSDAPTSGVEWKYLQAKSKSPMVRIEITKE